MKKLYFLLFILLISSGLSAQSVFINEIHYDNAGGDMNEGVEIAGPAGTDLTGWSLEFYNGSNGTIYSTLMLSGIIDDEFSGFGALAFLEAGIQNGAPDGIALIDDSGTLIQFLSYEGTLTATDGTASGTTSTDIGVSETSSTILGESLQLTGMGEIYTDFSWTGPVTSSFGDLNAGQTPTLGLENIEILTFSLYPNPTKTGSVNIKTTSNEIVNISVFNVLGKQVISQELTNEKLDISNLNSGVYLLKLTQKGNSTTKKLVVE